MTSAIWDMFATPYNYSIDAQMAKLDLSWKNGSLHMETMPIMLCHEYREFKIASAMPTSIAHY